ncbi:efflux RND transporter periplasmic adaptor subunit [Adhaeretor mobilis]|uniref:Cobalt-zinc-cadmium resistance protein CzcB n=1 Tax=Adhaeretor mobilis TaxID=1930276 RepID=A0A517MQM1_9BACT|nr:efflux RND transporter periplasmic adaptor subunit [Adhaeretor mobilis]QDS97173.1 Cobalt-zinc-cadmium resistance protein CzcB [Adhaeretor mobilis]
MKHSKLLSAAFALIAIIFTGWLLTQYRVGTEDSEAPEESSLVEPTSIVRLSEAKQQVAAIQVKRVERGDLSLTRMLPARFAYDDTRHVAVRAATDGVLVSVDVRPGDTVEAGQPIAVLRSPATGTARSKVLTRLAELELAKTDSDRCLSIYQGVKNLTESIQKQIPVHSIEQQLGDSSLGSYRRELLTDYSKALLAAKLARSASGIRDSGAISGRVLQQRESEVQQARASLEAAIDQSLYDTRQAYNRAAAAKDTAQRSLEISRQTLATLLGTSAAEELTPLSKSIEADLALLQIRSPITGTVERKVYSANERVTTGSELFIIADTSQLWVEADIRDRDWQAVQLRPGDRVTVSTPAVKQADAEATIYFVGREVDPLSGAIPLVASIENHEGRFRPGLFARVEVPIGVVPNVLMAPDSAVVDLNGESSVFVQTGDGYLPVTIETGAKSSNQWEVRAGLTEGQQIVVEGAFILKSELLLEGEE